MPLKLGLRFSMKALIPSFAPFLVNSHEKIADSKSNPCSKVVSRVAFIERFAPISELMDLLAMAFTISLTACSKFYVGSSCAIFNPWASLASIGKPVRIILFATFSPTILGKICVPPRPGMIPSVISGNPNCALSEHRMMSQRRASSKPPPKALPCTTPTSGLWCCLNFVSTFLN